MRYDAETDLWVNSDGISFIKNEFDINNPCFIELNNNVWKVGWKGQVYSINWGDVSLPDDIKTPIKVQVEAKFRSSKVAATHVGEIALLMHRLSKFWPKQCDTFQKFGLKEFASIWDELPSHNRSTFRQIVTELVHSGKDLIDSNVATRISKWKARSNVKTLRYVLDWHPELGALTSAELELFRSRISKRPNEIESDKEHAVRLLCWTLLEQLKRTEQLLSIKADGLTSIVNNGITEYFLEVPKSKSQSGLPPDLCSVSEPLAKEFNTFSNRPKIMQLQQKYNRLIVWDTPMVELADQISSPKASSTVREFVNRLNIISPRTKKTLHVTPYRLRHSGATRMAAQGVSREVIMQILEHDDITSAQSYIDAIGSDLVPEIEKADRKLGDLFKELNDIFFKGKVVSVLGKAKVFIPIFNANPMPVGSCGKDTILQGECKKQPFVACYNGCAHFLAWTAADHTKALTYVEKELERWSKAEGHNARSKAIKDFEQLHHAINEVIHQVERSSLDVDA